MQVAEFMSLPLSEAISKLNMVNCQVHTNDNGEVKALEITYKPNEEVTEKRVGTKKW